MAQTDVNMNFRVGANYHKLPVITFTIYRGRLNVDTLDATKPHMLKVKTIKENCSKYVVAQMES